jgi:hypothetical protein
MRLSIAIAGILAAAVASAQGGFSGPGRYEIMNEKSGKVLALDPQDQTTVAQLSPRGDDAQQWLLEPGPNGSFFLRSALDGRALTLTKNARSAPVICQRLDRGSGQQWRIDAASADGKAVIVSLAGGRVLDIPNGSSQEGLRIQIYDRNGNPNQRFVFRHVDELRDREQERHARWDRWEREHH